MIKNNYLKKQLTYYVTNIIMMSTDYKPSSRSCVVEGEYEWTLI